MKSHEKNFVLLLVLLGQASSDCRDQEDVPVEFFGDVVSYWNLDAVTVHVAQAIDDQEWIECRHNN